VGGILSRRLSKQALGEKVIQSIQPGQQIIKIIHDELVTLLGSRMPVLISAAILPAVLLVGAARLGSKPPRRVSMGRLLHKQGRTPLLVACDVYRAGRG